jgi:hypothetical protein
MPDESPGEVLVLETQRAQCLLRDRFLYLAKTQHDTAVRAKWVDPPVPLLVKDLEPDDIDQPLHKSRRTRPWRGAGYGHSYSNFPRAAD